MVKKRRQFFTGVWQGGNVTVCFDTVIGLGSYIELEQVVDEAEADQVAPRLHDLAANLGLTEVEPKSYLRLVLEAAAKARKE
jgi:adenylate cyclase class 2